LSPLLLQRRHPHFDPKKHGISRLLDLYFQGELRHALNISAEMAQLLFANFLYHALLDTIVAGEGTIAPGPNVSKASA
ncbi:hypothetical protein ACXYUI_29250, partial [Klebsiella pneumoniae]